MRDWSQMDRRWLVLPVLISVGVAVHGAAPAALARKPSVQALEAAFAQESYPPRTTALLRLFSRTHLVTLQIFRSGPEQGRTRSRDVMRGVAVGRRTWVGTRPADSSFSVRLGKWPSGLHFAPLTAPDGAVAFAPFVLRPQRLGEHRIAVVLPTRT